MTSAPVPRILLVEDNAVLADVLRFNLSRNGFEPLVARHGLEAMQLLQSLHFDLLITDYQMPDVNGEQLCAFVRTELQLHELPILMCSAKGLELSAERLRSQWNVSRVIFKPFSMREILSHARNLLASTAAAG